MREIVVFPNSELLKFLFLFFLFINVTSFAQLKEKPVTQSSSLITHYVKMNINNVSTFIYNNGKADLSNTGDSGFEYPTGSGRTLFYESGLLWTAFQNGKLKSGGSSYYSGLSPGKILPNGQPESPILPSVRAYRVRPDYKIARFENEKLDERKDSITIFNQYEKDWNEWPVKDGAPFTDVNKNGLYDPSIDIPGFQNADQTIWFVANDLDSNLTKQLYGSLPLGIEMQVTVWAYKGFEHLKNVIFKKYLVINKNQTKFDDMYFGIWSDPDLGGDGGDDLVGCDTILNSAFCYNGDDSDPSYGSYIPAAGFGLMQGPIVNGQVTDVANFKGRKISGKKNLPMTALGYFGKSQGLYHDPPIGKYEGTVQLYNLIRGLLNNGEPVPDPIKGGTTTFPFSGDPVTRQGFNGGINYPGIWTHTKYDHRMMLCCGPFNMAPGDTQEVIIAQLAGGGQTGQSRFAGISHFKKNLGFVHNFYKHNFSYPVVVDKDFSVRAVEFDREIILSWGEDQNKINEIEQGSNSMYSFQGYNVYQLSRDEPTKQKIMHIASFDIVDNKRKISDQEIDPQSGWVNYAIKQFGSDSGIQRFISINKDYFYNEPLYNGSDYVFGVSYYSITKDLSYPFNYYESPIKTVWVKPQSLKPGVRLDGKYGDIIIANHTSGTSSTIVSAFIVNPDQITGDEYKVSFKILNGKIFYSLYNISKQKFLIVDQSNLTGDNSNITTEGFVLKVNGKIPLTENDVYQFRTNKIEFNEDLAKKDFEKINVFPNPYFGGYKNEINKYDRHLTFSHLPQRAIIRIFNLAGQMIRKLEKDSQDQFFKWNMLTESYFQIPSGLYIAHIELPDFGVSKVLKFSIVSEVFVPDSY
jgi:hypothetical protein